MLNYGHLKMLETGRRCADYHICGVISDEVVKKWISPLICNFEERKEVIEKLVVIDETMRQDSMDPTENLKLIHAKFPEAKICLIQSHHLWESMLGAEYIKQIKGEIVKHSFYPRLSRDSIALAFYESFSARNINGDSKLQDNDVEYFKQFFSTKANTLRNLKAVLKKSHIEPEYIFTVKEWNDSRKKILNDIRKLFTNSKIVARSSCLNEDSAETSNAGCYKSILNISADNKVDVVSAVSAVIKSYDKDNSRDSENQILIQRQTEGVSISGVIFTRNLGNNAPYYIINFDDKSGRTDTVTGGLASKKIEILKTISTEELPKPWDSVISSVRELEQLFSGSQLDIEFAVTAENHVVIFQVRPLAANSKFRTLDDNIIINRVLSLKKEYENECINNGVKTIFSDMSFWNPAELIGDRPKYLARTLFKYLIMDELWNSSLLPLGYRKVARPLMKLFSNKPYINVNYVFEALTPIEISDKIKNKLMLFYAEKLKKNPEIHDKIEFECVINCWNFDISSNFKELENNGFTNKEIKIVDTAFKRHFEKIFLKYPDILKDDIRRIKFYDSSFKRLYSELNKNKGVIDKYKIAGRLIESVRECIPCFCRAARVAFISSSLLKSLANKGIDDSIIIGFMNSLNTVTKIFESDYNSLLTGKISKDEFVIKYGHLRPGTYDITKLPYFLQFEKNKIEYKKKLCAGVETKKTPAPNKELKSMISFLLADNKIRADAGIVLKMIQDSIKCREYFKFVYTKYLCYALESFNEIGEYFGFSREEMSFLDFYTLSSHALIIEKNSDVLDVISNIYSNLIKSRKAEYSSESLVSLPPLIFDSSDFSAVKSYSVKPNFITSQCVSAMPAFIDGNTDVEIENRIVVVDNADPGYDWIFTRRIKGLITKYGGAASHMAIRCAEFNIPAAIGCGECLYAEIKKTGNLILDCEHKRIIF